MPVLPDTDEYDYDEPDEPDEFEEALENCSGRCYDGVFLCGAAGSEDCDFECPFSRDIGLTAKQIRERDKAKPIARPAPTHLPDGTNLDEDIKF